MHSYKILGNAGTHMTRLPPIHPRVQLRHILHTRTPPHIRMHPSPVAAPAHTPACKQKVHDLGSNLHTFMKQYMQTRIHFGHKWIRYDAWLVHEHGTRGSLGHRARNKGKGHSCMSHLLLIMQKCCTVSTACSSNKQLVRCGSTRCKKNTCEKL
jgi:hypothetical protein